MNKDKKLKGVTLTPISSNELAELIGQVRVLEFKIITSFIQNRNNKIEETIAIEGYAFDFLPLVSAQLIKEKDEILVEFNNLYDSDLATRHRGNFFSQVTLSIASIISSPLLEHHRKLVEQPVKVLDKPPLPTMEEFIKGNYQPFDFEGVIQRHTNEFVARWSAINIWRNYEHYMNEIIQHCTIKIEESQTSKEDPGKPAKDKLTHKQQILLLHSIGFFDLEIFKYLNETQKGVLVSHIVNRDEKNSEDNIRYVKGKRASEETKGIFTKANLKTVNELLEKVGLKQYKDS